VFATIVFTFTQEKIMAISNTVKKFLDDEKIKYVVAEHPLALLATEVVGTQDIHGKKMIKSVIVKADGAYVMCVLPAIHLVDFAKLKKILGTKNVEFADEGEIAILFPDYDVGAEPPFGQLYGLRVVVDGALDDEEEIIFNAGTHSDVIKMKFSDFKRIVTPTLAAIGSHI
jgi:Ala-tRNA(Pro) deacylase